MERKMERKKHAPGAQQIACALCGALLVLSAVETVRGDSSEQSDGAVVSLPLCIYDEGKPAEPPFTPSGWMGNIKAIEQDDSWTENPHNGDTCIRVCCGRSGEWMGVAWQRPANDWGYQPFGLDLSEAKKVTFWARGERGGEKLKFRVGLLRENQKYRDSMATRAQKITLTRKWRKYTIPLCGNKSFIKTGFVWSLDRSYEGLTFYLDDIFVE